MKVKAKNTGGFTLIELLVVITIIAMLAAGAYAAYGALMPGIRAKQAAKQTGVIYTWLNAWSLDNSGAFPKGDSANLAFRELFKRDLGADEMQFYIANDFYHDSAPDKKPDGDKGRDPEYAQALEPGENAFAYVSGLSSADDGRLPLVANGFAGQPGVWSKNATERGGVFKGKYGVVCRVSGSAAAHDLKGGVLEVREKSGGQEVNIFTEAFSDVPFTVVNPL